MTSGWKKIEGQQFRLFGISHRKPVRHDDGMVYQNQRRNIPESNQLTKLAARARENGFYARVLPLPADTILGRQRWGLYLRPKEKYSWDSRFNGTGFDEGVAKELDRPKEWSADVLSRNKRREGQLSRVYRFDSLRGLAESHIERVVCKAVANDQCLGFNRERHQDLAAEQL